MKSFVLMNKKTGDLLEGYRVTFMDAMEYEHAIEHTPIPIDSLKFVMVEQHGWVISHPEVEVPWFMNRKAERFFAVLSEL